MNIYIYARTYINIWIYKPNALSMEFTEIIDAPRPKEQQIEAVIILKHRNH